MERLDYYLDKAKQVTGSDYKTAKILGMSTSSISNMRVRGSMDVDKAVELAKITGINPMEIIAACNIEKHPENAEFWGMWEMVPRGGIEPPTRGFSILCSTD